MTSLLLVSIVVTILSATTESANRDGLYISNGTDILYFDPSNSSSTPRSVYNEPYGRIVGLAYHNTTGYIFWSDVSIGTRGIYRGTPNAAGGIPGTKRKIVDSDILEVNGLSVDWLSNNLYWTDGRKRTIEVLKLDGTYTTRRILISTGLTIPRGIYADPVNKYLFWNDQGTKQIERSSLDGSNRQTIVPNINFPNQMVVSNSVLYWVNSDQKTFESCSLEGTNRKSTSVSAQTSGQHIFGLAINGNTAYISSWINGNLIQINTDGSSPTVFKSSLGTDAMFSAIFFSSNNQPTANNPCTTFGCSQLCFPITDSTARCSCSSFGGYYLSSTTTCARITDSPGNNILLYALADEGYVGFYPNPTLTPTPNTERYLVGRSLRPVAVAYDPVQQFVYWSDVAERTIHKCKLDGTQHDVFMQTSDGIGIVDGMVIDYTHRQLYYTNMGSMTINNNQYTWHKVEAVGLDSSPVKVRTIVGTAEKPRALALDQTNGYLYYTDWGNKGMIVRVQLDGSNPTIIRSGLDNPNGITIQNNQIFIVDSHYKSRDPNNPNYPNKNTPASLYSMNMNGSNFNIVSTPGLDLQIPFGLGSDTSGNLYISDWGNNKTTVVSPTVASPSVLLNNSPYVMSLLFSPVTQSAGSNPCSSYTCGDICLTQGGASKCACNSYKGKVLSGTSCTAPTQFLLVADMNSIKLVGLDTPDQSVYSLIQGTPFISNFAGMTYDQSTQTIYYNDISSKTINAYFMSNQTTVEFYHVNQVIDGMVFEPSGKKLYWTDFTNGRICFLDTTSSSTNRLHSVLQTNLDRPRAIKIYNSEVYWTEWGQTPRVAKSSLTPYSPVTTLVSSSDNLIWPNGIFFDSTSNMYIGDGAVDSIQKIIKCNLIGKSCVNVMNSTVGQHVYDLWVSSSGTVYYTDWSSGSVSAFSHSSSFPVVQGLMRPTQMAFVLTTSATPPSSTCPPSNQCQSSTCLPLLGGSTYGCDCSAPPGTVLSFDKIKCIDTTQSSNKCNTTASTSATYNYGSKYQPNPCTSCQCWAGQSGVDSSYPGFICERKDCPALDCPVGSTVRTPDGQCCPVCDCGLQITDCPTSFSLTLPSTQDFAVFEYLPSIRDCTGKSRTITQTKTPVGDVYRWQVGAGTQQVIVAYTVSAGTDSDTCNFNINLIDVTPPVIICPSTVKILTFDDTAKVVTWSPPQVTENVGYTAPVATPTWGSDFSVGVTQVKYVVTDYAGLSAACTFTVNVTKLTPPSGGGGSCVIPRVQNGFMTCDMVFNCMASCNPGYNLKLGVTPKQCVSGAWYPVVPPNFEQQTCNKPANKSVTGYINVTSPTECLPGIKLQYTVDFLQDTIRRNGYLGRSSYPLKISVKGFGCSQNIRKRRATNDIINKIAVTGQYSCFDNSTLNDMKADIQTILNGIKSDLQRGFFNLPFRSSNGISTAVDPIVTDITWSYDCPDGQVTDPSTSCCAYCPAGTFQSDPNTCSDCTNGTYNDQEGAFQCKSCPSQYTSPAHSVIAQQCTAVPVSPVDPGLSQTNKLIIGIVVGVGGFLILLIIIIIVYCCCCRRRKKDNHPSNGVDNHHNPMYKGKDGQDNIGIYDHINEGEQSSNDYSTLQRQSPIDDQPKYESLRPPSPDRQPEPNHS